VAGYVRCGRCIADRICARAGDLNSTRRVDTAVARQTFERGGSINPLVPEVVSEVTHYPFQELIVQFGLRNIIIESLAQSRQKTVTKIELSNRYSQTKLVRACQ
jgi:hypothetical protein